MHVNWNSFTFKDATEELKFIAGCISKLRNELQTDKAVIPLRDNAPDTEIWNLSIAELAKKEGGEPKWFKSPWLYVECYMYRRIQEAMGQWWGNGFHYWMFPSEIFEGSVFLFENKKENNLKDLLCGWKSVYQ